MPPPLPSITVEHVEARNQHQARDSYLVLYSVMKGASVAVGCAALNSLLHHQPELVLLWLPTLLLVAQTYFATLVGAQLLPRPIGLLDVLGPLIVTICEVELFLVLDEKNSEVGPVLQDWLAACFAFGLSVSVLLMGIRRKLWHTAFEPWPLFSEIVMPYLIQLRKERCGVAVLTVIAFALSLWQWVIPEDMPDEVGLAAAGFLFTAIGVGALLACHRENERIAKTLAGVRTPNLSQPAAERTGI